VSDARFGEYKLARQTATTAHFARAKVRIEECAADRCTMSATDRYASGWEASALAGAEAAICELRERGFLAAPQWVDIIDFVGLVTDTRDSDARWAAFMAVFAAFPEAPLPGLQLTADEEFVRS